MKLTLATCALGALGLTPALYGSHGEPKPQQPLKPVLPAAPVAAPAPVALAPVSLAPVAVAPAGGAWLPQPESPARLYVSALREQTGNEDLARDAERLQEEIKRLRGELKAMQKDLKKSNSKKKSKSKPSEEAAVERRALEEARGRVQEERHRLEKRIEKWQERREETQERREEMGERREEALERAEEARERAEEHRVKAREIAEEARGQAKVLVKGRLQDADVQDALAKARVLIGKSKDGKSFEWSGKDGEDVEVFMFEGDDDGHKRVFKHVTGGQDIWGRAPKGSAQGQTGSKIDVGGPNTFHIHVEEGDVHIHTNGSSSITTTTSKTSRSKGAPAGATKDLFGRLQHGGPSHDAGDTMSFFAKVIAEDGEEPTFELNFNGQEIELDNLEEIIGAVGESASGMALEGLLGGLEGLEGLEDIDVDFDFDFDDLAGLEGLKGLKALEGLEGLEGLEEALESLESGGQFSFDFDFDFEGDDECDDECEDECDEDEESEEGSDRDERFVRMFPTAPIVNPATARWNATKAWPARVVQPARFRLTGGQPAPVAVTAEEELLKLAREIQADVQAMRAELDELREEVRSAPPRAPSRR